MSDHSKHGSVTSRSTTSESESVATCPVCQMEIQVTPETPRLEYAGETFFFCDEGCRDELAAKPSRYVK